MTKDNQPAGHTAGLTYKLEGGRYVIDMAPGRAVGCTAGYEPLNEANARLWCGAAELLAAAQVFADKYDTGPDGIFGVGLVNADFLRLKAAIRRAQPEQSAQQGEG